MAKNKATADTIYKGNFYKAGDELPDDHAELSKGKTRLGGIPYANQVAAGGLANASQEDRPGMSGSGKPQVADIVDSLGHPTKQGEKEAEDADKASKKEEKKK